MSAVRSIAAGLRKAPVTPQESVLMTYVYAHWCGRALALSHARAGSAAMLSGYMGKCDEFDEAIADFSMVYAEQNEKDHAALARAVRSGKVKAEFEQAA